MCPLSPTKLIKLFSQGSTDAQGEVLVAQYSGQWRDVVATVDSVIPQTTIITSVSGTDPDYAKVTFFFAPDVWAGHLRGLMPSDQIRVSGQVHLVTRGQVIFNHCALVPDDEVRP